uniref:Reverse transcriptase domain-containing protein n=1 Tax=Meloidogyne hapla TaxID=6305 RepID=A0A1I8BNA4_MELHA
MAKLDNSNNSSPDGIPNIFYNKCRDTLVIPLTHIFSLSILSSKIPTIWKKAIINPIPKKSNPKYPIDFRPISLLCSSSEILEKIIANELQSFIEANNILPNCQHGFRKSHSVSTQLLEVMDDFTYSLGNKCLIDGACIFVTEYGTVDASGTGGVDESSTKEWWTFLDNNKISYLNWGIYNKAEGAAALTPGSVASDVASDSRLTASGSLVSVVVDLQAVVHHLQATTMLTIIAEIQIITEIQKQ